MSLKCRSSCLKSFRKYHQVCGAHTSGPDFQPWLVGELLYLWSEQGLRDLKYHVSLEHAEAFD